MEGVKGPRNCRSKTGSRLGVGSQPLRNEPAVRPSPVPNSEKECRGGTVVFSITWLAGNPVRYL